MLLHSAMGLPASRSKESQEVDVTSSSFFAQRSDRPIALNPQMTLSQAACEIVTYPTSCQIKLEGSRVK
jgi:hypothetical protein